MSATVMGIDVSNVPTADLMELAASLLEVDERTIGRMISLMNIMGTSVKIELQKEANMPLAAVLRERAGVVRAMESAPRTGELDS